MLDDTRGGARESRSSIPSYIYTRPRTVADRSNDATCRIAVWVRWAGESTALVAALRAQAAMEQFQLIDTRRTADDPAVWLCWFDATLAEPNRDSRMAALCKHVSKVGTCLRAERVFQRAADDESDLDAYRWDAFTRQPLAER